VGGGSPSWEKQFSCFSCFRVSVSTVFSLPKTFGYEVPSKTGASVLFLILVLSTAGFYESLSLQIQAAAFWLSYLQHTYTYQYAYNTHTQKETHMHIIVSLICIVSHSPPLFSPPQKCPATSALCLERYRDNEMYVCLYIYICRIHHFPFLLSCAVLLGVALLSLTYGKRHSTPRRISSPHLERKCAGFPDDPLRGWLL